MSDVHYSYLHGKHRHVTIARSVDLENRLLYCGISICHPSDVFSKSLGREIARGRLESEKNNKHSENKRLSMARRFADACNLTGDAADYFVELVGFNQAKDARERNAAYGRLKNKRLSWTFNLPEELKPLEAIMLYFTIPKFGPVCISYVETPVPTCVRKLALEWRLRKLEETQAEIQNVDE